MIHPVREGRSERQYGRKGLSNHRWIVGGKLCLVVNQDALVVAWAAETAHVHDTKFQPLIEQFDEEMIILADTGFNAKAGNPQNLKICQRGTWNVRMVVETVLSMLTLVNHFKQVSPSSLAIFQDEISLYANDVQSAGKLVWTPI
jgi:hypothetical protein